MIICISCLRRTSGLFRKTTVSSTSTMKGVCALSQRPLLMTASRTLSLNNRIHQQIHLHHREKRLNRVSTRSLQRSQNQLFVSIHVNEWRCPLVTWTSSPKFRHTWPPALGEAVFRGMCIRESHAIAAERLRSSGTGTNVRSVLILICVRPATTLRCRPR